MPEFWIIYWMIAIGVGLASVEWARRRNSDAALFGSLMMFTIIAIIWPGFVAYLITHKLLE